AGRVAVRQVFSVVNVTHEPQHAVRAMALGYAVLITALVAGSLAYLSTRYGEARRFSARKSVSDAELDAFGMTTMVPSVTILVPSYKEDPAVVRKTLLSAALQDYPLRAVVLLIDDPPIAATYEDARSLEQMR